MEQSEQKANGAKGRENRLSRKPTTARMGVPLTGRARPSPFAPPSQSWSFWGTPSVKGPHPTR